MQALAASSSGWWTRVRRSKPWSISARGLPSARAGAYWRAVEAVTASCGDRRVSGGWLHRSRNRGSPPDFAAALSFSDHSENGVLDAEETGKPVLALSNQWSGTAYGSR